MSNRDFGYSEVKCFQCGEVGNWERKERKKTAPDAYVNYYVCTSCGNTQSQEWLDDKVRELMLKEAKSVTNSEENSNNGS